VAIREKSHLVVQKQILNVGDAIISIQINVSDFLLPLKPSSLTALLLEEIRSLHSVEISRSFTEIIQVLLESP
jgi:hypothetical protein